MKWPKRPLQKLNQLSNALLQNSINQLAQLINRQLQNSINQLAVNTTQKVHQLANALFLLKTLNQATIKSVNALFV